MVTFLKTNKQVCIASGHEANLLSSKGVAYITCALPQIGPKAYFIDGQLQFLATVYSASFTDQPSAERGSGW